MFALAPTFSHETENRLLIDNYLSTFRRFRRLFGKFFERFSNFIRSFYGNFVLDPDETAAIFWYVTLSLVINKTARSFTEFSVGTVFVSVCR